MQMYILQISFHAFSFIMLKNLSFICRDFSKFLQNFGSNPKILNVYDFFQPGCMAKQFLICLYIDPTSVISITVLFRRNLRPSKKWTLQFISITVTVMQLLQKSVSRNELLNERSSLDDLPWSKPNNVNVTTKYALK